MPFLLLLIGAGCLGVGAVLIRISDVGAVASAFWRVALAVPALWALYAALPRAAPPPRTAALPWRALVVWSGIFFAIDLGVWHISVGYTTVANSSLLANCTPLLTTLYVWFVRGKKPGGGFLAALALALAGAVALVGPGFSDASRHWRGDLLALIAACFYSAYLLILGPLRERLPTLQLMAWSSTVSAIVFLPVAWLLAHFAGQPLWPHSASGWWVVVALALVSQVAGQGLIAYAAAHLPVQLYTTGLLFQPLVAAVIAWLAFGESLSLLQIAGAVVLLTGISLARGRSR